MDLLIQISSRYSDWSTISRIDNGTKMSAQLIVSAMESAKRQSPEHRVRAVDEDGRLIDML